MIMVEVACCTQGVTFADVSAACPTETWLGTHGSERPATPATRATPTATPTTLLRLQRSYGTALPCQFAVMLIDRTRKILHLPIHTP
jgi:hypothetical protein